MNESIPVLWSDDISSDPASPIAILRAQQRPLRQKTKGLLEAEIETTTSDSGRVGHGFDLVAPALNRARYRILVTVQFPAWPSSCGAGRPDR